MTRDDFKTMAIELQKQSNSITITDVRTRKAKESIALTAKDNVKKIKEHLKPKKDFHFQQHKKMCALENAMCAPFEEIFNSIERACTAWDREQQRIQQEAARKAREAARKAQEEQRLAQAQEAERLGFKEAADAILEAPLPEVKVKTPPVTKFKGARKTYYAEVVDMKAFLQAAIDGTIPMSFVQPNQKVLDATARAQKDDFKYPGCVWKIKE